MSDMKPVLPEEVFPNSVITDEDFEEKDQGATVVTEIRHKGGMSLVEWTDEGGILQRNWVYSEDMRGGFGSKS